MTFSVLLYDRTKEGTTGRGSVDIATMISRCQGGRSLMLPMRLCLLRDGQLRYETTSKYSLHTIFFPCPLVSRANGDVIVSFALRLSNLARPLLFAVVALTYYSQIGMNETHDSEPAIQVPLHTVHLPRTIPATLPTARTFVTNTHTQRSGSRRRRRRLGAYRRLHPFVHNGD